MTEAFLLSIETEEHGKGVATFSIEGYLADGTREVIHATRQFALENLVRSLVHTPDLAIVVGVLNSTGNTFQLVIDLSRAEAQAIADGLKLYGSKCFE